VNYSWESLSDLVFSPLWSGEFTDDGPFRFDRLAIL